MHVKKDGKWYLQVTTDADGEGSGVHVKKDGKWYTRVLLDGDIPKPDDALQQVTKLGVVAPHTVKLAIPRTADLRRPTPNVLKFDATGGEQNLIVTLVEFDNADQDDFEQNDNVIFDGEMKLRTSYSENMKNEGALGEGTLFSADLHLDKFKSIESVEVM